MFNLWRRIKRHRNSIWLGCHGNVATSLFFRYWIAGGMSARYYSTSESRSAVILHHLMFTYLLIYIYNIQGLESVSKESLNRILERIPKLIIRKERKKERKKEREKERMPDIVREWKWEWKKEIGSSTLRKEVSELNENLILFDFFSLDFFFVS